MEEVTILISDCPRFTNLITKCTCGMNAAKRAKYDQNQKDKANQ